MSSHSWTCASDSPIVMVWGRFAPVDGPLASVGLRVLDRPAGAPFASDVAGGGLTPLTLRELQPAPCSALPAHRFDPIEQVTALHDAADEPTMAKDWTTVEGTHTDGDGGDNESWGWEEV